MLKELIWVRSKKGRLKSLMWSWFLLCYSMLLYPLCASAVVCTELDNNKPTIAAGRVHTVGLKEDGTVVAVGLSNQGQLNVMDWINIKAIAAGNDITVGLKEDGTLVAVGNNYYSQLNVSDWTNIKAIAAGAFHTVGLREDGTMVAVGNNSYGVLNVLDWTNIKAVAAGWSHTVGLKEDGTVVAVGDNYKGQLNVQDWANIKAVATGFDFTVGLKEDGTVVAIGENYYGQLDVSGWTNIKAIAAGWSHTVGLKEDGTMVAVGNNSYGVLNVLDWTNIKAITAGLTQTVGLKEDGTVLAVGYNNFGQIDVSGWTNIRQPNCLNYAPVADAGSDQMIECASPTGASVTLDGSGSTDPDGDPLTHTWTWAGGSATGVRPMVQLPLGASVVTLSVSDGKTTANATVNITVRDSVPPVTTATGGSGAWYNTNMISTFSASDSCSGIKEIHYIIDGSEIVVSGNYASATLATDGIHNISYFAIDNAGNSEVPKSMTVMIDKTVPVGTILINNGTGMTNTPSVTLTISASDSTSGVSQMCVSNTTTCSSWEAFNTTKNWILDSSSDHMTVYIQFRDAAGNESSVYSDDIYLDADGDGWRNSLDCRPNDPQSYPGAPEIKSDGIDQDCNGWDLTINKYGSSPKCVGKLS